MQKKIKQAKILRNFRKIHKYTGISLVIFFLLVAISGIALGWKKHSAGIILPKTQEGTSKDLKNWIPIYKLETLANEVAKKEINKTKQLKLDKIDVRKNKGIVKFIYKTNNYEVQLDGATGKVLHKGVRYSDWIEDLHDGSLFDDLLSTNNEPIKVSYTSILGVALVVFCITGIWLWYGPKQMRKNR